MLGSRTKTTLLAGAMSPLLFLAVAVPAATPAAAAEVIKAQCEGIAPLQPGCSATGTFGSPGVQIHIGSGVNVGYTGDLTLTVTSATWSYSWTLTFTAGLVTNNPGSTQTGSPQAGQSFTLDVSAPGTGYYIAYVYET